MDLTITNDVSQIEEKMREYALYSQKSWGEIVSQEIRELAWGAYNQLHAIRPKPSALLAAARGRNWRSGRKGNELTEAAAGISNSAWRRAKDYLSGRSSGYVTITESGDSLTVKPASFSGGSKKLARGSLLRGRGGKSSLQAYQLDSGTLATSRSLNSNLKHVNLRALASAIEVSHRMRAAKGGTVSRQWISAELKQRTADKILGAGRHAVTFKDDARVIGETLIKSNASGNPTDATITGKIPGTERPWTKYGIWQKIVAARIADREKYIQRKVNQAAARARLVITKIGNAISQ